MDKAIRYFPYILAFFHAIGVGIFLYFSSAPDLSYINIFMSAVLVLIAEKNLNKAAMIFAFIFITGYMIELVGVQTGLLFGTYEYQPAMGPLLFGTPIIIGATWYAVVAGAANIARYVRGSLLARALLAGFLAVLMDLAIEQVAVRYGLWQWEGVAIPLYNYLCWFVFGTIFAWVYLKFTDEINKTAFYLFWIWAAFFTILTLF